LSALGLTNFTEGATLTYFPQAVMPQEFTWIFAFINIPTSESAGLCLYSNVTVGTNTLDAWIYVLNYWTYFEAGGGMPALQFAAQFQGTAYPQPGTFQAFSVQPDGTAHVELLGTTGSSYTLEASSNLMSWVPVASFTNFSGPIEYDDVTSNNFSARFYRLSASAPIAVLPSSGPVLGPPFSTLPTTVNFYTQGEETPVPPGHIEPP
jgi:hypothetical protein